ncbi:hypothetical protein HL658_13750 [Azospirillum sp. RWY-5-1]|uniref:Uncharacterized protein n=1 Tax=Azospirillum oleiclasticum TaxID=2735135 RepID=A0ABX2T8X5_9PROT|nr:hypothetical protein [Azospirillum oleiclasticum]NYZ13614.1 hypothetical protein [Azospirillum oleiclasticum]NYZ20774.1 hypothetical protein [Azospirillum oleiclasticum]
MTVRYHTIRTLLTIGPALLLLGVIALTAGSPAEGGVLAAPLGFAR